ASLTVGAVGSANPLAAPFSVKTDTCSNQTIAPSASCTLTVAFAPTSAGTFTDSFNIPSNDPAKSTVTVNVSGTGATAPTAAITVTDSVAPTTDLLVPFGNITVGASATQTVTVTNSGTAGLTVGAVGSTNPLAAPFTITSDTCSNQTIAPSAACTLTIGFAPTSTGVASDSFNIPSNDPSKGTVTVNVSGTGATVSSPAITVTDSVAPTNDLLVPFGAIAAGSSGTQTVTVTNSGNAALVLGAVGTTDALAAPFTITADTCSNQTIAPAASCTLTIAFAPTLTGTFADSFNIPSNDPGKASVTVSLSGIGASTSVGDIKVTDSVAPVDDLQVPFGNVRKGRSVDNSVTITNEAGGNLVIGSIGSANPLAAPFSITSDNCSGKTLASGDTCTMIVRFSPPTDCANPSATGTSGDTAASAANACQFSDSLDIPSDDPDEQVVTVQVSGTGVSSFGNNPPSKPKPKYPADHQQDLETSLNMQWEASTDPDGDHISYELRISTDPNFSAPMIVNTASAGKTTGTLFASTGIGFLFFGVVFAGTARGRKGLLLIAAVVILAGSTLVGCSVGGAKTPASGTVVSQPVSGLQTSTTYYWKVIASDGNGGVTESDSSSFTTK
ncbi:MAG: choice-of-anchor D domain-containing protein, partial [Betaproteobacteria bacterium]